ncbi:hypothetical protein STCU_07452 [Strigomonas culicis]|uniref:Kringle domain-containing protein n=1 Tax=Strigomonas culicis TaxID=28005 RepID=S9U4B9_9TRYP|nr:hypothetical protein STCU_07452 [Strigomonas culicis]|eukprot:EPY23798.1 hypothetical protein STCU_07452 [Strigomonas culicis]
MARRPLSLQRAKSGLPHARPIGLIVVVLVWCIVHTHVVFAGVAPMREAAALDAVAKTCDPVEGYLIADGRDYRGVVNVTVSGYGCQKWTSQTPWTHDTEIDAAAGIGDHNYCRNPSGASGPMCYTTNPSVRYERCDVGDPCDYATVGQSITYAPPSGSSLVAESTNNYVAATCFPSPCSMYYALDGSTPTAATGTKYTQPIVLSTNTTITTLAVFSDGSVTYAQGRYIVEEAAKAPAGVAFYPSTAYMYTAPVLVSISGLAEDDEVLLFVNDEVVATEYRGPFWITSSSTVTAAVNGRIIQATYTIDFTPPEVTVYPASGAFLGGVRMLVQQVVYATFYTSINGSAYAKLSEELLLTITTPGTHNVSVKAVYLGDASSVTARQYVVTAATRPTISPDASTVHYRPVNVTCVDPTSLLLPLTSQSLNGESAAAVVSSYVYLDTPGFYSVSCSYVDSLAAVHLSSIVLQLQPQALPLPTFSPACGESFSGVPLSLHFALTLPNYSTTYDASRFDVETGSSANAVVDFVVREGDVAYSYGVRFPTAVSGVASFTFNVRALSTDPMESSSAAATCTYHVVEQGRHTTPMFAAQPTCYSWDVTGDVVIDDACATLVTQQVAQCLYFYNTDNITVRSLGPYVGMYVSGLDSSLVAPYAARLGACLNSSAVMVEDVRDESSGLIQLATSWRLADGADINADGSNQSTVTGNPFLVEVRGINMNKGIYKFVPSGTSCRSIGIDALLSGEGSAALDELATMEYLPLLFVVDTAGVYKLCVEMDTDSVYAVPSTSNLTVTVGAWPTVTMAAPCGGAVDSVQSSAAIAVSAVTAPSFAFSDYRYALYHSGAWQGAGVQASGGAVTLPAVSAARPYGVVGRHAECDGSGASSHVRLLTSAARPRRTSSTRS